MATAHPNHHLISSEDVEGTEVYDLKGTKIGSIDHLMIDAAKAGKCVVRLKGGDPFIFGRGGEEAEALVAAGIPFEVVPGVTSAIAAAPIMPARCRWWRGCGSGATSSTRRPRTWGRTNWKKPRRRLPAGTGRDFR